MELDPRYVDVIVKRWEAFTGKQAALVEAGRAGRSRSFAEVAAERGVVLP